MSISRKRTATGACGVGTIAALLGLASGCQDLLCLEGTIERDDGCVAADAVSPEANSCGPGTQYSASAGACVLVQPPTECGPNTVEEVGEDGTVVCVGVGGGACDQPIACPQPSGGTTVCGWIRDAETGQPLVEGEGTDTSACIAGQPAADGPCALEVFVFDAIQFATAPEDARPIEAEELTIDRCGRFRVVNAPVPSGGIIAITTDDSTAAEADAIAHSGIASRAAPGLRVANRDLLAVRHEIDESWTASAGDPFAGTSLIEKGVALVTFRRLGEPVAGVTTTVGSGPEPTDDFYFGADQVTRTTIDPAATSTGSNGTALMVNVALQMLSGQGQESEGCVWGSELAATPANTVFVAERVLVDDTGDECQ